MKVTNKILYFLMGAFFALMMSWNLSRPLDATTPTTVEKKVSVLSDREVRRIQSDIATLEKNIQEDHDFLDGKTLPSGGKGAWSSQYAQKKNDIEQNLSQRERNLATLKSQLEMLRM